MKYVAVFASSPTLTHFCRTEFLAVAQTLGVDVTPVRPPNTIAGTAAEQEHEHGHESSWLNSTRDDTSDPFFIFESHASEQAIQAMAERCILLRHLHVLLQAAPTLEALLTWCAARASSSASASPSHSAASTSSVVLGEEEGAYAADDYVYRVETVGKRYSEADKRQIIDDIVRSSPALQGRRVNSQHPRREFLVLVQHAVQQAPGGVQNWSPDGTVLRVLHVVALLPGGRTALLAKYDLKRRPYIGTTSMPPEESILMANFAGIRAGHLAIDPFCGTGSLLVAAAHCGAHTFGADADGRAMHAGTRKGAASPQMQQQRQLALSAHGEAALAKLTPEEQALPTMRSNFAIYGLPLPDCARMNFSLWKGTWRATTANTVAGGEEGIFDAILTDPPYGLREPRKKVADGAEATATAAVPQLTNYNTNEVLLDLVLFAGAHLRVGGRLAMWLPTTDGYTDDELPTHPSLRVLQNLPQRLSLKVVRRLVTMEKVAPQPVPPPSRADCAARKNPDDLRRLMDQTTLPENADYTHYRARVQRRMEAARQHNANKAAGAVAAEDGGEGEGQKRARGRKVNQEEIVANREKNMRIRKEKQEASHLANIAHKHAPAGEGKDNT